MNTYEVTKVDGTLESLTASGYSWDKSVGGIAFYHANGDRVAAYGKGEWTSLHMRSPLVKADHVAAPAIKADAYAMY
jgi:hypothetical protein